MNNKEDHRAGVYKRRDEIPECMFNSPREGKCLRSSWLGGRGLCPRHYSGALYHIKRGNETWESLEARGVCRKPLSQKEKNSNQSHPHQTYRKRVSKVPKRPAFAAGTIEEHDKYQEYLKERKKYLAYKKWQEQGEPEVSLDELGKPLLNGLGQPVDPISPF